MRHLLIALTLVSVHNLAVAQRKTVPLYSESLPSKQQEQQNNKNVEMPLVYNISNPTLTIYEPANPNGTGIVVAPGGGFMFLSIKTEGYDVAEWLTQKGFTVFLLKYRTLPVATDDPMGLLMDNYNRNKWEDLIRNQIPTCVADGRAAIEFARTHAAEYRINPNRIGIIGFSAGGTVAASAAFDFNTNNRPDFAAPIYPYFPDSFLKPVSADAPPMFLLASTNDEGGFNLHCINLYKHWFSNKKVIELHLYANGGHGFGMLKQNLPKDNWIERFYEFLQGLGYTKNQ